MRATRCALAALALAVACGGASDPEVRTASAAAATRPGERCPRDRALLGDACWSAAGTRWEVEADGPGGVYRFDLELLAAGRARATDHDDASPAADEWFQEGPLLRVFLSDRFVEYRARVTNGTLLLGEAVNTRGQRWAFSATRAFEAPTCLGGEVLLTEPQACLTLLGTRWRLEGEGLEASVIELLRGGQLGGGGQSADDEALGTWSVTDGVLTFDARGERFEARIESADRLGGTRGEPARRWSATRLASVPPVLHR